MGEALAPSAKEIIERLGTRIGKVEHTQEDHRRDISALRARIVEQEQLIKKQQGLLDEFRGKLAAILPRMGLPR